MELVVVKDYQELSRVGAEWVKKLINAKPDSVVIPALGNTPIGMYGELTAMREAGQFDTTRIRIFQLDGYLGLAPEDERSLTGWLRRSILEPWQIEEKRAVLLAEDGVEVGAVCEDYDRKITEAGGVDVLILGLGPNGHLGFNEPPSTASSPTREVLLTAESIRSNAVYWGGEENVPKSSLTAGMDVLLGARHILLLVSGENKQDILRKTIEGPVSEHVPSSFLQTHPNVTVIADKGAWPQA
ncbi:putative glucosamine-6-phosphate deaminase 2 [Paenibacillus baekrokdamisoli]|uniref:Putative glucosamine-6-phosphate deaminase 2 n=1 Tax=Paenibacillus baekrokdamisoli TaxID=1712516 RepID=A0A3G9JPK3_9BACL|nr:glucosamine-6-phosphate deaminase [Paenibacillus baekrokdamisoli]MBB3069438.1 glucosamine-6-phosphate deaminase [Paenibacillus baekrokdamisoli]BBH24989.1 putative glucosamine-6-phosphate deaminase 2 [Paenibacillus baekrokdamisoli]